MGLGNFAIRSPATLRPSMRGPLVAAGLFGIALLMILPGVPSAGFGAGSSALLAIGPAHARTTGVATAHPSPMGSGGYTISILARNGNVSMNGSIAVTNITNAVLANASFHVTIFHAAVNISWGDGAYTSGTQGSGGLFQAVHCYNHAGAYTLAIRARNLTSGQNVSASFPISGPSSGSNGSGTTTSTVVHLSSSATGNSTLAMNLTLWLNSTIYPNASARDSFGATILGPVTGGTTPYNETVDWGTNSSPYHASTSLHRLNASYAYPVGGSTTTYLLRVFVTDAAPSTLVRATYVSVPGSNTSGSGGNSTTVTLSLSAQTVVGPQGVGTEFSWNISGGHGPYLLQINSSDGWYYRNVSPPMIGSQFHTYAVGPVNSNYSVFAFATEWPPNSSVTPGSAHLFVFPSYSWITGATNATGNAANGSFLWVGSPTPVFAVNFSYVQTNYSYTLAAAVSLLHGSGSYSLSWETALGRGMPFGGGSGVLGNSSAVRFTVLSVNSPGYYYVTVTLANSTGDASTWGIVHPTLFRGSGSGGCGCNQQLHGSFGGMSLVVNLTFNATPNWFTMQVTGFVSGGLPAYQYQLQFVGGNTYGTINGPLPNITIGTSPMGNATLYVNVTDSRNLTVGVSTSVYTGAPNTTGNGSGHSPYPAPVSVVVAADPVLGTAPLGVTLSAYISGGAPPFTVDWSLPGSTTPSHAPGVSVVALYNHPGWYPATAFVYNTTTPHGSVLVGFGSVWVDVRGPGSSGGNGSGNGSGGGHGGYPGRPVTPVTSAGGQPAATGSMLLWGTLLIGAIVGGVVGVVIGSTRPRLTPRSSWERAEAPPPRSRP